MAPKQLQSMKLPPLFLDLKPLLLQIYLLTLWPNSSVFDHSAFLQKVFGLFIWEMQISVKLESSDFGLRAYFLVVVSGHDNVKPSLLWRLMLVFQQFLVNGRLEPLWFLGCSWTFWPIYWYLSVTVWVFLQTVAMWWHIKSIWNDDCGICRFLEMAPRDVLSVNLQFLDLHWVFWTFPLFWVFNQPN